MTSTLARRIESATGLGLSIAVLGMIGIRLWNAGGLWRDECGVVQLARLSTVAITKDFTHEAFPPPFFLVIRLWMTLFGASDFALRWYGFVLAVGLIAALWFVFRLTKMGVPLISLGAIGISSSFLLWGTSIRGYGIGTICALIFLAGIGSFVIKPDRRAAIIAAAAGVFSVQFLLQNTIIVSAIVLSGIAVCLIVREWNRALIIAVVPVLAGLSFVLYTPSYLRAREWSIVVESTESGPGVIQQLGEFFGIGTTGGQWIASLCVAGVIAVGVQHIYVNRCSKSAAQCKLITFSVLVFFASVTASEIFFRALHYTVQPWYLLVPFGVALTAIDLIVAILCQSPLARLIRVAIAIAVTASFGWINRDHLVERQTNVDLIAKTLKQTASSQDLIVVNPWQLGIPMQWYYHGNTTWITLPQLIEHRIHRYDLVKTRMMSSQPIRDVFEMAKATLQSGNRLWVVGGVRFPLPGRTVRPLTPAPGSQYGWDNVAYGRSWNEQFGEFIQRHAIKGRRIPVDDGRPVNAVENVPLIVTEGWKD